MNWGRTRSIAFHALWVGWKVMLIVWAMILVFIACVLTAMGWRENR